MRDELAEVARMGSEAAELLGRRARPTHRSSLARVASASGATYTVTMPDGSTLAGVGRTTGAAGAVAGDECVVEFFSGRPLVTGIVE